MSLNQEPVRRGLVTRMVTASARFMAGFALQVIGGFVGAFASEDDAENPWFRRGEIAAYVALAMLALGAVALLILAT